MVMSKKQIEVSLKKTRQLIKKYKGDKDPERVTYWKNHLKWVKAQKEAK